MKLALVTAGYHRLGAVIAARLAEAGWTLALHSRKAEAPDDSLTAMLKLRATETLDIVADLSDATEVAAILPAIQKRFGRAPDLIVNNASLFEWDDPVTVTAEALARHHAVNVAAPILLSTSLAQALPDGARANVINILDQRVRQPNADQISYTISKQSLASATETLARSLAPKLRVNAVAPGLVIPTEDYLPVQMQALEAMMPLNILPEPDDIADAVLYLANAHAVTGQIIFVDGGAAMRSFERDFVFLGR